MSMIRDIAEMIGRTFHSSLVRQGPDGRFYLTEDEDDAGPGFITAPEHVGNLHRPSESDALVVVDGVEYCITVRRVENIEPDARR